MGSNPPTRAKINTMSRTPGSGWGAGPLLYQICPKCGKKKAIFKYIDNIGFLHCTLKACHAWTQPDTMIRKTVA